MHYKALAAAIWSSTGFLSAAIRPSLDISVCTWNATDILVLAPTQIKGSYRVAEAIIGGALPGTVLALNGLAPPDGNTSRLRELARDFPDGPFFEDPPPIDTADRIIVFLRQAVAQPRYNPRPDIPAKTDGWQPANWWGDLRVSAIWLQDGVAYGFAQTINPGPSHLIALRWTEGQLRDEIRTIFGLRGAFDHATANHDPAERSRELAVLVRSNNGVARTSALARMKNGGDPAADVLHELLADEKLLMFHDAIVEALVGTGAHDLRLAVVVRRETLYWSQACRVLKPGWWNNVSNPDYPTPRAHYSRVYAALRGIRGLHLTSEIPAVREFVGVWNTCAPLDESQARESSQVSEECALLLRPDAR